jgi:hypothetical protein
MLERYVNLEIDKAFSQLRIDLLERGCKIISEEPPKNISVHHGSLRGVSPKSAKKLVAYELFPTKSETRIASYSSISSDWANLTLWGNIAAGVIATLFWWVTTDITHLVVEGRSGYWTWLAGAFGYPNVQYTLFMINVTKTLSLVLIVTILLEILDVFIVKRKINTFAEETLIELTKK